MASYHREHVDKLFNESVNLLNHIGMHEITALQRPFPLLPMEGALEWLRGLPLSWKHITKTVDVAEIQAAVAALVDAACLPRNLNVSKETGRQACCTLNYHSHALQRRWNRLSRAPWS